MRHVTVSTIAFTVSAWIGNLAATPVVAYGGNSTAPTDTPELTLSKGQDHRGSATGDLDWTRLQDAFQFDLVRGDLPLLIQTQGDFTQATSVCLANDTFETFFQDPDIPGIGGGFWYVVRGVNNGGNGTYDDQSPSQAGSRDAKINASAFACP